MTDELIVNLCPTGMVPRRDTTPAVPITPEEIAADVRRCADAGASMVHLHARADDETPTWRRERFDEILAAVHAAAPDIITVVTTSGRNWNDIERRAAALDARGCRPPEMASLTLGSMNFPTSASVNSPQTITTLAERMRERGIVPELEVFDVGQANLIDYLQRTGALPVSVYVNFLWGSRGTAALTPINVAAGLAALPRDTVWSFAGIGRFQLRANVMAIALGGHVRVGLEDNPYLDWSNRSPASNPRLVERVVRIAQMMGRDPASANTARHLLGLPAAAPTGADG